VRKPADKVSMMLNDPPPPVDIYSTTGVSNL
jgi:hypothetical protein